MIMPQAIMRDTARLGQAHAVDMHQIRSAPQRAESEKNAAVKKKPEGHRPEKFFHQHPPDALQQCDLICLRGSLSPRFPGWQASLCPGDGPGPSARPERPCRRYRRRSIQRKTPSQGIVITASSQVAANTPMPPTALRMPAMNANSFAKPLGENFHGRNKDHGNAEPDQDAAEKSHLNIRGKSEHDTTGRGDHQKEGDGVAGPDGVG